MTAISRELQYLQAHRQVDDTRRLRELWRRAAQRDGLTRRLPWLMRALAAAAGLVWLVAAGWSWNLGGALAGLVVLAGGWVAAEIYWWPGRRTGSLAWELDRLNPQLEGAFCLLDWLDAADGPARGPRQAVLEVTLARVDWNRPVQTPDRQAERQRALKQIALLGGWVVAGVLLAWWLRAAAAPLPPAEPAGSTRLVAAPPPVRQAGAPRITELKVRIEPPAYTGLPAQETFQPTIQAPVGSRVTVRWRVAAGEEAAAQSWVRMGERRLTAAQSGVVGEWRVAANVPAGEAAIEAQAGGQTARQPVYLVWREDRAPTVRAEVPEKIERAREGVRFQLHVEDDYGLTRIEVLVSTQTPPGAATTRVETITLPLVAGQDSFHGAVLIPAATLDALRQDRLRLQVKAWDSRTDETGRPEANIGSTDPVDFLVVQPWDNARKPRSLDRKPGADGDQPQTGDSPQGGDGAANPGDGLGPKMLQKNPDEPPGPQQSQPQNPGSGQSKYSQMAGSQGDPAKSQSDQQKQPGNPAAQPGGTPPPSNQNDPNGPENRGGGPSTPSTDGVKTPEPRPPSQPPRDNAGPANNPPTQTGDPGDAQPPQPGDNPASSQPQQPPQPGGDQPSKTPAGGGGTGWLPPAGAGESHSESRTRSAGSQDTDPTSKGNAAADESVSAEATTSVEAALAYAREKPLGAWQRNFGGNQVQDRLVQSNSAAAGGNLVTGGNAGGGRVAQAGEQTGATETNLAAERAQLDQRFAARIEQYLQRVRREGAGDAGER